jgi:hypothetical protein
MNHMLRTSYVDRTWCVLNWNIRGVNSPDKWPLVHNKIEECAASIVCLQETKKDDFDVNFIKGFAPRRLDKFAFVPSDGASVVFWCYGPATSLWARFCYKKCLDLWFIFSPLYLMRILLW